MAASGRTAGGTHDTEQPLPCLPAELLAFLRDAIDTRKPPVMELALDLIQKMISFKLLQGPVYNINHRWALWGRQGGRGGGQDPAGGQMPARQGPLVFCMCCSWRRRSRHGLCDRVGC